MSLLCIYHELKVSPLLMEWCGRLRDLQVTQLSDSLPEGEAAIRPAASPGRVPPLVTQRR